MSKNVTYTPVVGTSGSITHNNYLSKYIGKVNSKGWYTTDIDLSFQSRARWDMLKRSNFINSCLINMNISKFILVDVKLCLANATEKEDIKYFQSWLDKGVYHLNVDSNNRTMTLRMFQDDLVRIPHGDYPVGNGILYSVDKTNDKFSTMDEDFRNLFLTNSMSVYVVTSATREQLSDMFMRMNNGEPLNFYEQMNCAYSTTCDTIRTLADDLADVFESSGIFKIAEINRRVIDGWFANVSYLYNKGINQTWGKPTHRAWYASDSASNKIITDFAKEFKTFINDVVGTKLNLFHNKWVVFDLFHQYMEMKRAGKVLIEDSTMTIDFAKIYTDLMNDPKPKFYWKWEGDNTQYEPFSRMIRGEGANTPVRFGAYKDAGWDISNYFEDAVKLDSKRTATKIEKQGIAFRDGFKDSDGDEFLPEELFDGQLDAGHIVAHANGGMTVSENLVIEKASKNRSKGKETTAVTQ